MITIKIKTPRDYWKQLQEWVKNPRQKQCIAMVDYQIEEFKVMLMNQNFSYLSGEYRERVIDDVIAVLYRSRKQTCDLIKDFYPKFNIPK